MEYYDVIIVGAGIAGCGLAYNLKRIGYKGSVLVIDKRGVGSNLGYGYRSTFEEVINEYGLQYVHKHKGMKFCINDKEYMTLNTPFYFIDYKKTCKYLFNKLNIPFIKTGANSVEKNTLVTDDGIFKFKYLVDCSGKSFFLKKILNHSKPFMFWIGEVFILKKKNSKSGDYLYFLVEDEGFVKDLYFIKDKIIYGKWKYGPSTNLPKNFPKSLFCEERIKGASVIRKEKIILPATPSFPLVYKNYILLGDSFGNATAIAGEGVRPILESSKILAKAIKIGKIKTYENNWKKKYLEDSIRYIALRRNSKSRFLIVKLLKKYPEIMLKILRNEKVILPKEIKKQFPLNLKIIQLYNYLFLKLYYASKSF